MIVSWNWLKEYVDVDVTPEELAARLTMAGLNLETIEPVDGDFAIDLEVTSNRPDCLGHIGIAREAAVLLHQPLRIPEVRPAAGGDEKPATSVKIECKDLCPQYLAGVIRGVRIQPSPEWMQQRLRTIGVTPVNNVVDVTNYVMMECGQPFHAFDFDKLRGGRIVVRHARAGETIDAIDHRKYQLTPDMCVIADAERPVAVGGVMGGAETEISEGTTNLLIEVANFLPLSIRATARGIRTVEGTEKRRGLHSPSSYRFERGVDPQQMLWAMRRCCDLILETAGGELAGEPVIAGKIPRWKPTTVPLRFAQIPRILGIDIPRDEAAAILERLGLQAKGKGTKAQRAFFAPSWRRDLEREVDLIEEIARIHGYEKIPEDRSIPVVAGTRSPQERMTERVRQVLSAAGFDEAITLSFQPDSLAEVFDSCASTPAATVEPAAGEYGTLLRKSLIPSLINCRRENERRGNSDARLYEVARVFRDPQPGNLESQPLMIGLVSGQSFSEIRGVLDAVVRSSGASPELELKPIEVKGLVRGRAAEVLLNGRRWGVLGELDRVDGAAASLKLRDPVTVAEFTLAPVIEAAVLIPEAKPLANYPAVTRDLNLILDEAVSWQDLRRCVGDSAGPLLEAVTFVDQYRGKQVPAGKKSYVFQMSFRSAERTLTTEEVDAAQQSVVTACREKLKAELRG